MSYNILLLPIKATSRARYWTARALETWAA